MYLLTYAPALCGHGDGARHGGLDAAGALGQHGDGGLHARHAAEGVRPLALRPGELLPQASTPLEAGTGLGLVSRDQRRLRRRIRLARARVVRWCVGACTGEAGGGSEWWLERSRARGGRRRRRRGGRRRGGGRRRACSVPLSSCASKALADRSASMHDARPEPASSRSVAHSAAATRTSLLIPICSSFASAAFCAPRCAPKLPPSDAPHTAPNLPGAGAERV